MIIYPDVIEKVFAVNGEQEIPPQLSANNFVNFETGYTPDYELRLNSNNPQAKAVERKVQNYMFAQLTMNAKAWQQQGLPAWYEDKTNGYDRGVFVLHTVNGVARPYRSLVDQNMATPGNDSQRWEYQQTMAEMISNIPMPAGGPQGSGNFIINDGGNSFNPTAVGTGAYFFATDAAAQATSGLPITQDGATTTRMAGLLEVLVRNTIRLARYTDRMGNQFVWVSGSAGSSGWRQLVDFRVLQSGSQNFAVASAVGGNVNTLAATLVPAPGDLYNGMRVWIRIGSSNTGNVTLNLNGTGAKPIIGADYGQLSGGEIGPGMINEFVYDKSSESWFMINPGFRGRTQQATSDTQTPNWGQVKERVRVNPSMTGAIQAFAHMSPGAEWIFCDGSAYSRTGVTAALFAAIGTMYGNGDGSTTFNVPNIQGGFIRSLDTRAPANGGRDPQGPRSPGSFQPSANLSHKHDGAASQAGAHSHTLTTNSAGVHQHEGSASYGGGHNHDINGSTETSGLHSHTVTGEAAQAGSHNHTVTGNTDESGVHSHTIWRGVAQANTSTSSNGGDNMRFDGRSSSDGAHQHNISGNTNSSGLHTHEITASAADAGYHQHNLTGSTTSANDSGSHTHSVTTANAGSHSHNGNTDSAGSHTHTVTTENTGDSEARPINFAFPHFIHI